MDKNGIWLVLQAMGEVAVSNFSNFKKIVFSRTEKVNPYLS
jgi:hypothetical protein